MVEQRHFVNARERPVDTGCQASNVGTRICRVDATDVLGHARHCAFTINILGVAIAGALAIEENSFDLLVPTASAGTFGNCVGLFRVSDSWERIDCVGQVGTLDQHGIGIIGLSFWDAGAFENFSSSSQQEPTISDIVVAERHDCLESEEIHRLAIGNCYKENFTVIDGLSGERIDKKRNRTAEVILLRPSKERICRAG